MRKRPRPDQIASILREFQTDLDAGLSLHQACRKAGTGPTTYYRWKALQENPISNEQLRISELQAEVERLKVLVAELALDRRMLQEALKKRGPETGTRLVCAVQRCWSSVGATPTR
jgi:putative transposase